MMSFVKSAAKKSTGDPRHGHLHAPLGSDGSSRKYYLGHRGGNFSQDKSAPRISRINRAERDIDFGGGHLSQGAAERARGISARRHLARTGQWPRSSDADLMLGDGPGAKFMRGAAGQDPLRLSVGQKVTTDGLKPYDRLLAQRHNNDLTRDKLRILRFSRGRGGRS